MAYTELMMDRSMMKDHHVWRGRAYRLTIDVLSQYSTQVIVQYRPAVPLLKRSLQLRTLMVLEEVSATWLQLHGESILNAVQSFEHRTTQGWNVVAAIGHDWTIHQFDIKRESGRRAGEIAINNWAVMLNDSHRNCVEVPGYYWYGQEDLFLKHMVLLATATEDHQLMATSATKSTTSPRASSVISHLYGAARQNQPSLSDPVR